MLCIQVPRSAIMLANSTSINDFWMQLNKKFDLMNRKRSFWHHYIQEGMPEEDFAEFREDLAALGKIEWYSHSFLWLALYATIYIFASCQTRTCSVCVRAVLKVYFVCLGDNVFSFKQQHLLYNFLVTHDMTLSLNISHTK